MRVELVTYPLNTPSTTDSQTATKLFSHTLSNIPFDDASYRMPSNNQPSDAPPLSNTHRLLTSHVILNNVG